MDYDELINSIKYIDDDVYSDSYCAHEWIQRFSPNCIDDEANTYWCDSSIEIARIAYEAGRKDGAGNEDAAA